MDPDGRSGGLLLGWAMDVTIHQILHTSFSIEVEFETYDSGGKLCAIFVYASHNERVRREQWEALLVRKGSWGNRWVLGGDLNDIRTAEEKQGGRRRSELRCKGFNDFIAGMEMEEIGYHGRHWTWANNWEDEGYIEARLDRFFGASFWFMKNNKAIVRHVKRRTSDHNLLILDTTSDQKKR